jgi:hypothetical protein
MMGEDGVSARLASPVQASKGLGKPYRSSNWGLLQSMILIVDTDDAAAKGGESRKF